MEMNDNYQMQIHIVSSVKGGCGKTAFSLFKAMEIAFEERSNNRKSRAVPVLWLDADFKGTGSKALLYGKDEKTFENMNQGCTLEDLEQEYTEDMYDRNPAKEGNWIRFDGDYVPYTINDYLRGDIKMIEAMTVHGHAYMDKLQDADDVEGKKPVAAINGFIDFIFSSPDARDKKIFQYDGGLPTVKIGQFTHYMQRVLNQIYNMGLMSTKATKNKKEDKTNVRSKFGYKHVILDMPPGDDAYSEALLDMLYKWADKMGKDKVLINYYLMTTSDRGHVEAMLSEMGDNIQRLSRYPGGKEGTLAIVLGEIRADEFNNGNVEKQIRDLYDEEQVKILKCCYQKEYYEFCRGDLTLVSAKDKWFTYEIKEEK